MVFSETSVSDFGQDSVAPTAAVPGADRFDIHSIWGSVREVVEETVSVATGRALQSVEKILAGAVSDLISKVCSLDTRLGALWRRVNEQVEDWACRLVEMEDLTIEKWVVSLSSSSSSPRPPSNSCFRFKPLQYQL